MDDASYRRVKHHQLPGDIPKGAKIAMRERLEHPIASTKAVRKWVRTVEAKTRAVLKRRLQKELRKELP